MYSFLREGKENKMKTKEVGMILDKFREQKNAQNMLYKFFLNKKFIKILFTKYITLFEIYMFRKNEKHSQIFG